MLKRSVALLGAVITLASCTGGAPPAGVAETYMSQIVGPVRETKVTNCTGEGDRKTCVVSYKRSFSGYNYYEELSMDFQKTPSGWNVLNYSVIKTDVL